MAKTARCDICGKECSPQGMVGHKMWSHAVGSKKNQTPREPSSEPLRIETERDDGRRRPEEEKTKKFAKAYETERDRRQKAEERFRNERVLRERAEEERKRDTERLAGEISDLKEILEKLHRDRGTMDKKDGKRDEALRMTGETLQKTAEAINQLEAEVTQLQEKHERNGILPGLGIIPRLPGLPGLPGLPRFPPDPLTSLSEKAEKLAKEGDPVTGLDRAIRNLDKAFSKV